MPTLTAPVISNRYRPTTRSALILSPDPLGGALVAAVIELAGIAPLFVRPRETARDALRRARPAFVLVDADDENARDEAFLGNALMMGAQVLLFGTARAAHEARAMSAKLRIKSLVFPRDVETMIELLASASRRTMTREG